MPPFPPQSCTAFKDHTRLVSGPPTGVALAIKAVQDQSPTASILVFDDATGRIVDLDLRGSTAEIVARLTPALLSVGSEESDPSASKRRGRPKLGVVAREITLLPRQWDWLAAQPGGASAVLRRLIDHAQKATASQQQRRASQEAAYHFMHALAGDFPGYEEATRALFADDRATLEHIMIGWPPDIRVHVLALAFG